jgi:hypothetical protein
MFRLELLRFLYKYHPYASKGKKPKGALQKLFKNYDERNNFQNVYALRLILDQSQINNLAMLFSYLEELEVNNKELDFQRERNQVKVNELTIQLSNEQQLSINRLENIVLFENRTEENN